MLNKRNGMFFGQLDQFPAACNDRNAYPCAYAALECIKCFLGVARIRDRDQHASPQRALVYSRGNPSPAMDEYLPALHHARASTPPPTPTLPCRRRYTHAISQDARRCEHRAHRQTAWGNFYNITQSYSSLFVRVAITANALLRCAVAA